MNLFFDVEIQTLYNWLINIADRHSSVLLEFLG